MINLIEEVYFLCEKITSMAKKELIDLDYCEKTDDRIKINFRLWGEDERLRLYIGLDYDLRRERLDLFSFNDMRMSGMRIQHKSEVNRIIESLETFLDK